MTVQVDILADLNVIIARGERASGLAGLFKQLASEINGNS